ncbi:hypothetical protein C5746_01710 [Streptomyces atratus]|uniref:Uncharacterized protein n=2 Tax=Streptomyces atratus TaxID=1893 RepID=A0A2Z5J6H6_STRAR|nr:hypothetical protein C5746_01710 [Streptomyces atratus]
MKVQQPFLRNVEGLPRWVPAPGLIGFLVLLLAMFAVSYEIGTVVGPVAPGMHSTNTGGSGGGQTDPHGGGMDDMHSGGEG